MVAFTIFHVVKSFFASLFMASLQWDFVFCRTVLTNAMDRKTYNNFERELKAEIAEKVKKLVRTIQSWQDVKDTFC